MPSSEHIETGNDPGSFNTDQPTFDPNHVQPLDAGTYDEASMQRFGLYPEGHLAHDLEHGYVLFRYDCGVLDEAGCSE